MNSLAAILAALLVLPSGAPIKHIRNRDASYLPTVAQETTDAARLAGVSLSFYASVVLMESHFDDGAVSYNYTSFGLPQIHHRSKHWRRWQRGCVAVPSMCRFSSLSAGAYALREALDTCHGNRLCAIVFYRFGRHVNARPCDRAVVRLAQTIAWRLRAAKES